MASKPGTGGEVHFEVMAYKGRKWIVVDVKTDENAALSKARRLWKARKHKAVKVVRERFDPESRLFYPFQIYYEGKAVDPPDSGTPADFGERPINCWKVGDLYSYEGRRTIGALLSSSLSRWQITPTELLHLPAHYKRLDDGGTELQAAVQKAAINQSDDEDSRSIQERMRQIFDLIEQAVNRLGAFWDDTPPPEIDLDDLSAAFAAFEGREDRAFAFAAALAQSFNSIEHREQKLSCCLDILGRPCPAYAARVVDDLLSELVVTRELFQQLVARFETPFAKLEALADLRIGALSQRAGMTEEVDRLNALLAEGRLPSTRTSLGTMLVSQVARAGRLRDDGLLEELKALSRLAEFTAADDGDETAEEGFRNDLNAVIVARVDKALNQEAVNHYLSGSDDPYSILERLHALEPWVVGRRNKITLSDYLLPVLMAPERERQLTQIDKDVLRRMRCATKLQRQTRESDFDGVRKDKIEHRYDQLCAKMLGESEFLKRVDASPGEPKDKALRLLQYLADGTFTEGMAAKAVRQAARRYMRHGNFLEACVADAEDEEKAARALGEIMALMKAAGLADHASP